MLVQTGDLTPSASAMMAPNTNLQVYCGLDCCLTIEVWEEIRKQLPTNPEAEGIYSFERALQAPYLDIMRRGFAVDSAKRWEETERLRARRGYLELLLNEFSVAMWGKNLNPRSPAQLADFFYRACRLPEVWISQKGVKKLSTNREALEKLEDYLHTPPIISCILAIRDIGKQLDVFESEIDSDNRFR